MNVTNEQGTGITMESNGHSEENVAYRALVDKTKKCLPPLHIKLGLTTVFLNAINKEGEGLDCVRQKFPHISEA